MTKKLTSSCGDTARFVTRESSDSTLPTSLRVCAQNEQQFLYYHVT